MSAILSQLDRLENQSIFIIREAYSQFRNVALLWSIGKDSTCLLWLVRKAFFGKIPFPVLHIDTTHKFQEIYEFRAKYVKEWDLNLLIAKNEEALARGVGPDKGKFECCNELKTIALKNAIAEYGFKALYLGIRRDEHGIRAKERVFSPRDEDFEWDYKNQPPELWDIRISLRNCGINTKQKQQKKSTFEFTRYWAGERSTSGNISKRKTSPQTSFTSPRTASVTEV